MHRSFTSPLARASTALFLTSLPCFAGPQPASGPPQAGGAAAPVKAAPRTATLPSPGPPAGTATLGGGNDSCAIPEQISGQGTFLYDLTNATTGVEGQAEGLCHFFGSTSIDNDVWFAWTSDATGTAVIDTCGDAIDTKIAVYPGSGCPLDGSSMACNDDSCCGLQSRIAVPVTDGSTYTIQVGTFPGAAIGAGNLHIWISSAANDECASPTQITGTGAVPFDLSGATTGCVGQSEALCDSGGGSTAIYNDVWFRWTADVSGIVSFQTCNSPGTKLAVYADAPCGQLGPALACDVGSCSGGNGASVQVSVTQGSSYLIQIGKASPAPLGPGNGWLFICLAGTAPGTVPFCYGDGSSGTDCPCNNPGLPCRGCDNGQGLGGGRLTAEGSNEITPPPSTPPLTLVVDGVEPGQPGLFFQGDSFAGGGSGVWLNAGLRCVGPNYVRLEVVLADVNGVARSTVNIAQKGGVLPGTFKYYQFWYRVPHYHPAGCIGSNLTNGLAVYWVP